jgi:hypothetical protein
MVQVDQVTNDVSLPTESLSGVSAAWAGALGSLAVQ